MKKDPWAKRNVYGRIGGVGKRVAHIVDGRLSDIVYLTAVTGLCRMKVEDLSPLANPYPVCKSCIRVAKETGLW